MRSVRFSILLALTLAVAVPALAQGQGRRHDQGQGGTNVGVGPVSEVVITDRNRVLIRTYYEKQFAAGSCPPGLAKKNNGCQPPGQAKNWSRGKPLGTGVAYAPLPSDLLVQLTTPVGYQFVRILNDVLLIAHGTKMVVDAVADLR